MAEKQKKGEFYNWVFSFGNWLIISPSNFDKQIGMPS